MSLVSPCEQRHFQKALTVVPDDNLINVAFAVWVLARAYSSAVAVKNRDRLEMNLGMIAASIATLRPLFASLGPMARVPSDPVRGPYASDRPLVGNSKASKAVRKLTDILLNPMGTTKTTDVEITQTIAEALEGRVYWLRGAGECSCGRFSLIMRNVNCLLNFTLVRENISTL